MHNNQLSGHLEASGIQKLIGTLNGKGEKDMVSAITTFASKYADKLLALAAIEDKESGQAKKAAMEARTSGSTLQRGLSDGIKIEPASFPQEPKEKIPQVKMVEAFAASVTGKGKSVPEATAAEKPADLNMAQARVTEIK